MGRTAGAALLGLLMTGVCPAISLTLAWDPPTDITPAGYVIYHSRTGSSWTEAGRTAATRLRVSNLRPDTPYLFRVVALDAAGRAFPPSASMAFRTGRAGDLFNQGRPTSLVLVWLLTYVELGGVPPWVPPGGLHPGRIDLDDSGAADLNDLPLLRDLLAGVDR